MWIVWVDSEGECELAAFVEPCSLSGLSTHIAWTQRVFMEAATGRLSNGRKVKGRPEHTFVRCDRQVEVEDVGWVGKCRLHRIRQLELSQICETCQRESLSLEI